MSGALSAAKVYVDFGPHPGEERLPREAVASGCCVITGTRGSAGFFAEVPISPEYKFDDREPVEVATLERIVERIRSCLTAYDARVEHFHHYRSVVEDERDRFARAVRAALGPAARGH